MLQNAYFLAKIGADTAENEQHFAEILPKGSTAAMMLFELPHVSLLSKVWPPGALIKFYQILEY